MARAAAVLLGYALQRLASLGATEDEIAARFLYSGQPGMASRIAESVRLASSAEKHEGLLVESIEDVLASTGGGIFRLIDAIDHLVADRDVAHWFPIDILDRPPTITLSRGFTVADAHLHSGASLSLREFLRLLAVTEVEFGTEATGIVGVDRAGEAFSVGIVVAGIRTFQHYLLADLGKMSGFVKPELSAKILAGDYWSWVRALARAEADSNQTAHEVADAFDDDVLPRAELLTGSGQAMIEDAHEVTLRFVRSSGRDGRMVDRRNAVGLLCAFALVNGYLRSYPGEGLTRFVDRFEEMSLARDVFVDAARPQMVSAACDLVLPDKRVIAAEFRKSIVGVNNASAAAEKIRRSLLDHVGGFHQFLSSGRIAALFMPVGFVRKQQAPSRDLQVLNGHVCFSEVWALATGLTRFLEYHQTAAHIIGRVDIAGDENRVPNWPFLAPFEVIAKSAAASKLLLTAHSGESFTWRMQGLRAVGELLDWRLGIASIGHALALDDILSDAIANRPPTDLPARVLLEDLLWLVGSGRGGEPELDLLDRLLAVPGVSTCAVDVLTCLRAWEARSSLSGIESLELGLQLVDGFAVPPDQINIDLYNSAAGDRRAALSLMYRGPAAGAMDRLVGEDLTRRILNRFAETEEEIAAALRILAIDRGVVIESCPTSNLRLSGLPSYRLLPIARWSREGLTVTISSDDPLIFGSHILSEFDAIRGVGDEVSTLLAANSVAACGGGRPGLSASELEVLSLSLGGVR